MGLTDKMFQELKLIAQDLTPVGQARIAAALVVKRDVLAYGTNKSKTHPMQKKYGRNIHSICLHAEIDCIRNALMRHKDPEILKKATLYIVRAKKKKNNDKGYVFGLAKPCEGCQRAIEAFGIKRVIYSIEEK